MNRRSPFNSLRPFNSLPTSGRRIGFLAAWRSLILNKSGYAADAFSRPQAARNEDRVFYSLQSRGNLQALKGYLGVSTTTIDVYSCSTTSLNATMIDLEIQDAIDRYSGTWRGHKFKSVVHQGSSRQAYRNGQQWIWYMRSTYEIQHILA